MKLVVFWGFSGRETLIQKDALRAPSTEEPVFQCDEGIGARGKVQYQGASIWVLVKARDVI